MNDLPPRPTLWLVVVAAIGCTVLWFANYWLMRTMPSTDRGTFGDMFGAANSIFTGLAFVGLVYANMQQRHEIAIARAEAKYTQKILDEQQLHLEKQNQESKKQSFENTFFQLLRLFTQLTENIDIGDPSSPTTGKDVFLRFANEMNTQLKNPNNVGKNFDENYGYFYSVRGNDLGHYFRILSSILEYVDMSDIPNKNFYTNIVRDQLSDSEIIMVFYNSASQYGRDRMKPLTEKFILFSNIDEKLVANKHLWDLFPIHSELRRKKLPEANKH